ncbi:DUF7660 family protein [Aquimarina algiphila]|uniref:DUF7660 family protein n=1 Tax=Aquimarina algiphila TaxID=2047982 RepID=UPI00232F163C|nr:hypothetical protein [Aquimarina algiphila]
MTYTSKEVNNKKDFSEFLKLLLEDFKNNGQKWENNNLELFLEAMQRYSESVDGYYKNVKPNLDPKTPTWRIFADVLCGAVAYE